MIIVTGGGSGIGRALAQALAKRHLQVLIIGRNKHTLTQVASESSYIDYLIADVGTEQGRLEIENALSSCQSIAGLIHNAGIIDPICSLSSISIQDWQHTFAINVEGPLFLTQILLEKLKEGRTLHIGSGVAYFPVSGWAAYCTSKAALAMLTRCWQLEIPDLAITSVMPGIIDTPMQDKVRQSSAMDMEKLDFFKKLKIEKRLILPEVAAEFLCWLLLDVDAREYISQEWDIYDTAHHIHWLRNPYTVPGLE
jgi:benzil reductase ((S)-benzoin forming)